MWRFLMIYEDLEYAYNRLLRTVILVKGEPAYIFAEGKRLFSTNLLTRITEPFFLKETPHDIRPVPLGFVNLKQEEACLYVSRSPSRQWKQGLSTESIRSSSNLVISKRDLLVSSDLGECIAGVYPSLKEAAILAKNGRPVAFSRNFFISGSRIMNRNHIIGSLVEDEVRLEDNFEYLSEQLKRDLL